ncbi:MAG: ADOP family duplicated permease [Candidatus Acidiferrales bacterium]
MQPEYWLYTIPLRLRSLFRRGQADQELDDELRDHVEQKTEEYVAKGLAPEEARRQALLEIGGVEKRKEECRDTRGVNWIQDLFQDLRYGLRMLRKSPGFTTVAVLSLALGIGATFAIFSVMYALALRPLPVSHPNRLVELDGGLGNLHTYPEWKIFRDHQNIFSQVLAYNYFDTNFNIAAAKQQKEVSGLYVSGDYFQTLGVPAVIGRVLEPSDDQQGAPPVCVLGYGLWRQFYDQSRKVLGQSVLVDGHEFQIVGVAPQSFFGVEIGEMSEIFMPLETERTYKDYPLLYGRQTPSLDSTATLISFVGRLKPGESVSQANAGLQVLSPEIYRALAPSSNEHSGRRAGAPAPLVAQHMTSDTWLQDMDIMLLLMTMAAVALIVACANLGNLLLARARKRQSEIATRLALGATRWRLIRQLLTESAALSLLGAAIGLIIARWASQALLWALSWPDDKIFLDLSWDTRLLFFAVGITLFCAVLFGLAPAARATRISVYSAMNNGVATGKRQNRLSNSLLVVLQVGLSMTLLVSAGLLARTLHALLAVNPGYDPRGVLLANASLRGGGESPQRQAFIGRQLLSEFRSLPGVVSASWSREFSQMYPSRLLVAGPGAAERRLGSILIFVSSDSFSTIRTPISAGRDFNDGDTSTSFPVAILSEDLAKALFGQANPIGLRFRENDSNGKGADYTVEVIGVTKDIQYRAPNYGLLPILYRPVSQCADSCSGVGSYAIRVAGKFSGMTKRLEDAAATVDPRVVLKCNPMTDMVNNSVHRNRAMALIAATFAIFVGLLAMIGVYGVTSYATGERTREIGIRMALGAQPTTVLRMVMRETLGVVCVGIAFGVAAGAAATRLIAGLIWGVKPIDPLSFALAICLMLLIAGIAAFLPARRAMRVDPMVALRYE